jgi:hypothetical protein
MGALRAASFGQEALEIDPGDPATGYLVDSLGKILVADYTLSLAVFTFVGEVLLIVWLVWVAIRGLPSDFESPAMGR